MSSIPVATRSLFNPQPMAQWDDKNAVEAKKFSNTLSKAAGFTIFIGQIGAAIGVGRLIKMTLGIAVMTPTVAVLAITGVALFCLGIYLKRLSEKHIHGMDVNAFAVKKQIEGFDKLPIYRTKEELEASLKSNTELMFNTCVTACEESKIFDLNVEPLYRPLKEIQPRFRINNASLKKMEHMQDLLDKAYERGILLEFSSLKYDLRWKKEPTSNTEAEKEYAKVMMENVHLGVNIALEFLERRLRAKDTLDVAKVNAQLDALGFKCEKLKEFKALKPNFYLENKDTLVIRGNCSEIPDLTAAVRRLADHVKCIKMHYLGLVFCKVKVEGEEKDILRLQDWRDYCKYLQGASGVPILSDETDHPIWQTVTITEPTWKDPINDGYEDDNRIAALKKAAAQPATSGS